LSFFWIAFANFLKIGEWGMYTSAQRDALISTLSAPLNSYFFVPHDDSLDPSYIWSSSERAAWKKTISDAKTLGIKVIMGLRPTYIDDVDDTAAIIRTKITTDFIPANVTEYILAWDDTPGAGTSSQMQLQKQLIVKLRAATTGPVLSGIVPAAYYPGADVNPSGGTWAQKLAILDGAPKAVRFFVTGNSIVPSSLSPSNIPSLASGRGFVMWDNWIATDSNTAVTMSLPPSRSSSLYTSTGYGLNLAFPPERIIHQMKVLIARASSTPVVINTVADQWATYLVGKGFVPSTQKANAVTCLKYIINNQIEDTGDIISYCPLLSSTFSN
jgi:hypothetical protein